MANKKPKTIKQLFEFYYEDFKPLYSHLQSLNEPPQELFFEVNAAFDHLSRHWQFGLPEEEAVNSAAAHIKRGCFDAFKIVVRETVDHHNEIRRIDTSIIDNGEFDRGMRQLISKIQTGAIAARQAEGDSRDVNAWHRAYELWEPVYADCAQFDRNYYLNGKIEWARRKQSWKSWRLRGEGVIISVLAGLIVWAISTLLSFGSSNATSRDRVLPARPSAPQPARVPDGFPH